MVRRKRICLLGSPLQDFYSCEFWRGAAEAAREEDLDLIYAVGGLQLDYFDGIAPSSSPFEMRSTLLYQLVDPALVDGVVAWGAQWSHDADQVAIRGVFSRFAPLPIVSVGLGCPGVHTVMVDNYTPMKTLVSHLIEAHGYRDIAFLKSESNIVKPESEARFQGYRDALSSHDVEYRRELVILGDDIVEDWRLTQRDGDYRVSWAQMGVEILLERRGLVPGEDFRALVGRDDFAALTAMDMLAARGVAIPRGVAICGFDDVVDGRCATPPLTTIHQSFYDQGAMAVRVLAGIFRNERVPEETVLNTARLVVRESCGCPSRFVGGSRRLPTPDAVAATGAPGDETLDYASELWDALDKQGDPGAATNDLTEAIERITKKMQDRGYDVMELAGLVSRTEHQTPGDSVHGSAGRRKAVEEALILLGDTAQRMQLKARLAAESRQAKLEITAHNIIRSFDLDTAFSTIEHELPELDIPGCSLALYDDSERPLDTARLCFCVSRGKRRDEVSVPGIVFPSRRILPEGYWPDPRAPLSLVVFPVFFAERRIGFLVFERGNPEGRPYFTLVSYIGSVLQGALLVRTLNEKTVELQKAYQEILDLSNRDTLTGLLNRRAFQQQLAAEKLRTERYRGKKLPTYSLLFIDLDNFKYYNDTFGHNVGDLALKVFADLLGACIRNTDTVARLGGDEFVILLPETAMDHAAVLGNRIIERIKEEGHLIRRIEELAGMKLDIAPDKLLGCSIGASSYCGEPDMEDVLKRADRALRRAKTEGKGRVCTLGAEEER